MAAKIIPYTVKSTMARTEYRKTSREDLKWVLDKLEDWMTRMEDGFAKSRQRDLEDIYDNFWCSKTSDLPKGRTGQNSPQSMVTGILENMRYPGNDDSPQYDLSKPQCEGIEQISRCMEVCFGEACPRIKFEKTGL